MHAGMKDSCFHKVHGERSYAAAKLTSRVSSIHLHTYIHTYTNKIRQGLLEMEMEITAKSIATSFRDMRGCMHFRLYLLILKESLCLHSFSAGGVMDGWFMR